MHNFFHQGPHSLDIRRTISDFIVWPITIDKATRRKASAQLLDNDLYLDSIAEFLNKNMERTADCYCYIDKNTNEPKPSEFQRKYLSIRTNLFLDAKTGERNTIYFNFDD